MRTGTGSVARITAQAKVNLFLRVLAREASGYHQLETLFCRLELGDHVTVRVGGTTRALDCDGPALPAEGLGPVEQNLAWRAAEAYRATAGWPDGFAIEIAKHVPVGGGLGGGSADAGAVLRCLDALAPQPLGDAAVLALAARLGADVPFVTTTAALALAWGRGERMLALPSLPRRDVLLYCWNFGVPTADAFGWIAESRALVPQPPQPRSLPLDALTSWESVATIAENDFEAVVLPRYPTLAALKGALGRPVDGRVLSLMSGSGATLFSVAAEGAEPASPAWSDERLRVVRTATAVRVAGVEVE